MGRFWVNGSFSGSVGFHDSDGCSVGFKGDARGDVRGWLKGRSPDRESRVHMVDA